MSYPHDQYRYASIPLPDHSHSYTIPTLSQKQNALSSELLAAQHRASRKRVAGTTCLITALIFVSLIGLNVFFYSFLCVIHQCQISNMSLVSTAPLGLVLTISQITSHIGPLLVPIIMSIFSYFLAAKWLRSSRDGGLNRPSPMQLGLLMSLCNGANISSLFTSVKYLFKRPVDRGAKVVRAPPILRESILFLGFLLVVTYTGTAADAWLHASSQSISLASHSPYGSLPNFGRDINATMCQLASRDNTSIAGQLSTSTCGLINAGSGGSGGTLGEGIRVVANSSNLHRVVFADDQTALLIPQTLPLNIKYSAQTLGIKTQCITITKECIQPTSFDGTLDYGPDDQLDLNCTKAGIKYANGTNESPLCPLDDQGLCVDGWEIPSNPFTAGEVVTSGAYLGLNQVYDAFLSNTGWFVHGNRGAWNVVFCNVTALEVTYTYASSRYFVDYSTPKSLNTARYMMSAGLVNPTTAVSYAVDGAGLQTNTTYEQAYALELSRQMLARGAFIYEPTEVIRIESETNVNGSSLQVIPLVLFIAAMVVFACQILYISLRTVMVARGVQFVDLAALHLGDPLAIVQTLYGHQDPVLTWETDSMKKFGFETEGDRLSVGPVQLPEPTSESIFTVTKG